MIRVPRRRSVPHRLTAALLVLISSAGITAAALSRGPLTEKLRATLREAERELDGGRLSSAGALYREALAESAPLGETSLPRARALDGLADVERLSGRPAEAVALYARSIPLWERLLGRRQPRLATTLHNLGVAHLDQGRSDLAMPHLRRALEIWEASLGATSAEARNTRRLLERVDRERLPPVE
jgi:tetratricopeptide (TPR) repeat protein